MATDALRKVHSTTGIVPLGAYLLFHAWEHWPARMGRDFELERLATTSSAALEILLVVLPLCVHGATGLLLSRTPEASAAYASPALRRLQAATGLVMLAFLVAHLGWVWLPALGDPSRPIVAFDAVSAQTGTLLGAGLYAVGLSAVCAHLGQGLAAALLRARPELPARTVRGVALALAAALWLALVDELAAYAAGSPLL